MKKTQWIELIHNIKHTLVSFIAVVLFVALATGLYTGIRWTGYALAFSVEDEYDRGRLHHLELRYPYGFDGAFADSLIKSGIVDEAEGCYETYRTLRQNGERYQAKIVSLGESIDRPCCVEGTLPTQSGEAAVNVYWAEENGVLLGDRIELEPGAACSGFLTNAVLRGSMDALLAAPERSDELKTDAFRVTAFVEPAEYMGKYADTNGMSPVSSAPIGTVIYTAEQSFEKDAFPGYPKLVVRTEALNGRMTTSDAYKAESERLKEAVEAAARVYTSQRNAEMRDSAERMGKLLEKLPDDADGQLQQIRFALESIGDYEASTATRQMNGSYVGLRSVMDTFEKMKYSLVSLFVVIGILVCYSTVSRLVYDQTVPIGMKKAMGFLSKEILKPFLVYSGIAALIGSVCGVLMGRFLIEPVMVASVRETYRFSRSVYYFGVREAVLFSLMQAAVILITAFIASVRICREKPLQLLTVGQTVSDAVHPWLERIPFWKRMPLMRKTIIRNCLNDPRRVFATLIGIMGCTALVVCALSTYDNLLGSFELHMEKVSEYDTILWFSGDARTREKLSSLLDENDVRYADAFYSLGAMRAESGEQLVTGLYAADSADFYKLLHLYDKDDGVEKRAKQGAWVNIAYAEHFGASKGDTLRFLDASGQEHELRIEGIYEYYLMNYQIVLPRELYEAEFGTTYTPNTLLLQTDGSGFDAIRESLLELEDGLMIGDFYGENRGLFESIVGVARAVTVVYLMLSAILAVLLLLNLFTMFVSEKKRELITLMINGFSRKAAERYIYADTGFLAVVGIAAGLVLGVVMGGISLDSFNNIATYFVNRFDWWACAVGTVFTAVLTAAMCRIALRRVRGFCLADIGTM